MAGFLSPAAESEQCRYAESILLRAPIKAVVLRVIALSSCGRPESIEKRLSCFEIGGAEAFGKPVTGLPEHRQRIAVPSAGTPRWGEAGR